MPTARRTLNAPFVLEKSKLNRILETTKAKFDHVGLTPHFSFQVQLRGQRLIQTSDVNEVLAIDNSKKSRIEGLYLTCAETDLPGTPKERFVSIDFDGTSPVGIEITVRGKESDWVTETFAASEEQAERTLQPSTFARMYYNKAATIGLMVALFFGGVAAYVDLVYSHAPTKLTNGMWLTDQDLKELEPLTSNGNLTSEKAAEVLSRQIRNVVRVRKEPPSIVSTLLQRRTIFVLVPCLLVLAALMYLYLVCYPLAVFLWGDAEDWYKDIVSRRNLIWTGILIALVVGVLGNLFVLGLHG